jgi:hypothetical protein
MIWGALVGSARINTALIVSNWPHA